MKIELHNVGPIEYFEFDTEKDLNLIYGKNSVGKSYAIYCVYNLLKNLYEPINVLGIRIGWKKSISILDGFYSKFFDRELIIKLKQEIDNSEKKVDVKEIILTTIKNIFQEYFIYNINQSFGNTFSSIKNLNNQFSKKDFLITIQIGFITLEISINNEKEILQISNVFVEDSFEILYKNEELYHYQVLVNDTITRDFSIHKDSVSAEDVFIDEIEIFFQNYLFKKLKEMDINIEKIYLLPSSRSGLYQALNSFSPIIAELAKSRFQLKSKKIELPSLSEPIADYFIKLSTLDSTQKSTKLEEIAQKIEDKILKGSISIDEDKKINFNPNNTNLSLDLSESSSMVAEIAPLVTYLRYIVNMSANTFTFFGRKESTGDTKILFIEEPEAHLHPEVQIQLMEIFVELTKLNVKVVITSHSNYMFQQLDNMILEGKIAPEKVASYHLVMGKNGSKDAGDMKATSEGMEDNNFVEISEKLYEKKMEIFDKLNADIINTD